VGHLVAPALSATILLGGCSGGGLSLALKIKPGEKATYEVTRSIRTTPQETGDGDKEILVRFTIESDEAAPAQIKYTVLDFRGNDPHDQRTTNHLSRIASVIKGTKIVGTFDKRLQGTVKFDKNPGGWAGFAALVAMGMYRPGLFGLIYPDRAVKVGDEWNAEFDTAAEHSRVAQFVRVANSTYSLKYKLDSIIGEGVNRTAIISYQFISDVTLEYFLNEPKQYSIRTNERGTVDVSLGTGLPLRATMSSTIQSLDNTGAEQSEEVNRYQVKQARSEERIEEPANR